MSVQIQKLGTHIRSKCRVTSAGLKRKLLYGSQQHAVWFSQENVFSRKVDLDKGWRDLQTPSMIKYCVEWVIADRIVGQWPINGPFFKSLLKNCYLQIEPCPTDKKKRENVIYCLCHNVKFWIVSNPIPWIGLEILSGMVSTPLWRNKKLKLKTKENQRHWQ